MSGLIVIQSVWHSDGIPERILKKMILKKNQQTTKNMQIYPGGRVKWGIPNKNETIHILVLIAYA